MNIFRHEILAGRRSTIVWSLALAGLVIMFLSMYPSFTKDVSASQKILENLPLAVRQALDISLGNFFTIFGFFGYLFTFISVAGGVQAMNIGLLSIGKETSSKTADFLLTKPVSRSSVISQKLVAGLCALLITNVIFVTTAYVTALVVASPVDALPFLLIAASLFLIQLFFLALGILLAITLRHIKSVIAISLPVVFGFFIVGSIGAIVGSNIVKYLTPFKYFDPSYTLQHRHYDPLFVVVEIAVVACFITLSYRLFSKKDIHSGN